MAMHASWELPEVSLTPQKADNKPAENAGIGRMSITKTFTGDLEAASEGEMLSAMSDKDSGVYVAIERVTGRLGGASIDCLTSSFSSRGSLPEGSIGSPMTTRIVPGFFTNPRLGQNEPALCDSGTTLLPDAMASSAPLTPNFRVAPATTRVPSGKMMIHRPSPSRALPCSMTWFTARCPSPRLIAMGRSSFRL